MLILPIELILIIISKLPINDQLDITHEILPSEFKKLRKEILSVHIHDKYLPYFDYLHYEKSEKGIDYPKAPSCHLLIYEDEHKSYKIIEKCTYKDIEHNLYDWMFVNVTNYSYDAIFMCGYGPGYTCDYSVCGKRAHIGIDRFYICEHISVQKLKELHLYSYEDLTNAVTFYE